MTSEPLDPAAIMAEHVGKLDGRGGGPWCWTCGHEQGSPDAWPCLPYRLAAALAAERERVRRVFEAEDAGLLLEPYDVLRILSSAQAGEGAADQRAPDLEPRDLVSSGPIYSDRPDPVVDADGCCVNCTQYVPTS